MQKDTTRQLHASGLLGHIDIAFADLLCRITEKPDSELLRFSAALVSSCTTSGKHVCLDLRRAGGQPLRELFPDMPDGLRTGIGSLRTPETASWCERIRSLRVVGEPGDYRPLVLDRSGRLYLYRFWQYEHHLARALCLRANTPPEGIDSDALRSGLQNCFPPAGRQPDLQKAAAFIAVTSRFCLVAGGPGTGKTATVARIIALLLDQQPECLIRLCAPTGKAAARLQESIRRAKPEIGCSPRIRDMIPETAATIHRMLGSGTHRLAADVVIVDEASMVPLSLMAQLVCALPEHARLILLGDRDQLASVAAGAVLADVCEAAGMQSFSPELRRRYASLTAEQLPAEHSGCPAGALADCSVELQHSYRFEPHRGIGAVSRAVNSGDSRGALSLIAGDASASISSCRLPSPERLAARLADVVQEAYEPLFAAAGVEPAFERFSLFRILCAHRVGPCGAVEINRIVEEILVQRGVIDPQRNVYQGKPVLITRNDYSRGLFNGDTGLLWNDAAGALKAWFPAGNGMFRAFSPLLIPEHETVYAMTVHKSQGSEFDRVLMILPDYGTDLLTRELIYTGITRARKHAELWMDENIFAAAVSRRVERTSGLRDALREQMQAPASGGADA